MSKEGREMRGSAFEVIPPKDILVRQYKKTPIAAKGE